MFGFRYHVVTICALFIMLGIGIVIGSSSGLGPALSKQEAATIKSLSDKLDNVLSESERDHALLRQHEEALNTLVPGLVDGKLAGNRIAIIRTGDYADAVNEATDAIDAGGGTVTSVTTLTNRLQLLDETQQQKIATDLKMSTGGSSDSNLASILHPLAAVFRAGTAERPDLQSDLDVLRDDGVIDESGDYSEPATDVVIVGGSMSDGVSDTGSPADESVESALLGDLTAAVTGSPAMTVVGCEPFGADESSMPTYSQAGISSVDCIDLPMGELDLPYALTGGDSTAYGVKPTATRLLPAELGDAPNPQMIRESHKAPKVRR